MSNTKEYVFPTAFSHWGDEEHDAMARVITSGRFTMGPETEAFEGELAAFNQRKHAIAVNSGSSANLIAVHALKVHGGMFRRGAAVPALAWGTTYAPIIQSGMDKLVLVDCGDDWCANYNVTSIVAEVAQARALLVGCSILGNPANLSHLEALSEKIDIPMLNDDCEALGATIGGMPTAAYGTLATQSFFYSHQLSAIEGGAVLTDDDGLARTCRMLRDHGLNRSVEKNLPFDREYSFELFGFNVRPLELHMAVAREQLKKVAMHRTARRQNWMKFATLTSGMPIKMPPLAEGANPFGIHFELDDAKLRPLLAATLRGAGVDCRLPTGGSFRLHPYGKPWRDQQTPNADRIHRAGMFIGNAPYNIEEFLTQAALTMAEVL